MSSKDEKKQKVRVPKQERSIQKFEAVVAAAMTLLAAKSYESISMREIAREADMPIASVYQYFPTKLSIVHEIWLRYTNKIFGQLSEDLSELDKDANVGLLIDRVVDLMVSTQEDHKAFAEVWGCVAAARELRDENAQDTFRTADLIAHALAKVAPRQPAESEMDMVRSISLIMCESAASTIKIAMTMPQNVRTQTIAQLKLALRWMYDGAINQFNAAS